MSTRSPENEARLRDVRALRQRGDAAAILARYPSIDRDDPEAWEDVDLVAEIARAHSLSGNAAQVERYFQRCAELHRRRAALYLTEIGWFYQRQKRWARAILWYDRSLETFPTYHLCLFRKGYCLERLHRPKEAVTALEAATATFDGAADEQKVRSRGIQAQVFFHIARSLREIGETDRARAALDRCAEIDCGPEIVIKIEHRLASYAASHIRDGDAEAAIRCLREAGERDPRSAVVWERLGIAQALAGRYREAEEALERATSMPKGGVALVSLARFYRSQRRWGDAANALASALERHPQGDVRIRLELADLHRDLGRPASALSILRKLATGRVPPGSTLARDLEQRAGEILLEHGELSEARAHLVRALEHDPESRETKATLARLDALVDRDSPPASHALRDAPLPPEIEGLIELVPPRHAGVVASYFSGRGFGFITYREREETIFFHVSHVHPALHDAIAPGLEVSFVVVPNSRTGRAQAEDVRRMGDDPDVDD